MVNIKVIALVNKDNHEMVVSRNRDLYDTKYSKWLRNQEEAWLKREAKRIQPTNWFQKLKGKI